jgi:hypothetical protein
MYCIVLCRSAFFMIQELAEYILLLCTRSGFQTACMCHLRARCLPKVMKYSKTDNELAVAVSELAQGDSSA